MIAALIAALIGDTKEERQLVGCACRAPKELREGAEQCERLWPADGLLAQHRDHLLEQRIRHGAANLWAFGGERAIDDALVDLKETPTLWIWETAEHTLDDDDPKAPDCIA